MALTRRLGAKRARFSCKKLAFLELQRAQRLEAARLLTRRKRLERVLFLPEVKEEVGELSSESVQRILHQGAAFHFSKDLVVERSDSLHALLFDDLLSVKRLSAHELVLLVALLQKLPVRNAPLLSQSLEQCELRFDSLTLAEVAHIAFITTGGIHGTKDQFHPLWMQRTAALLRRIDLEGLGTSDCSTVAKLAYAFSYATSPDLDMAADLISSVPLDCLGNTRSFARDCGLLCRSMVQAGCVNTDYLMGASDCFQQMLRQHVESLTAKRNRLSVLSERNVLFSLPDEDHSATAVSIQPLMQLIAASEQFGYHHRPLLEEFCSFVEHSVADFRADARAAEHYRRYGTSDAGVLQRRFAELLRSRRYVHPRTGKHDLGRLFKALLGGVSAEPCAFWDVAAVHAIGSSFVTQRRPFAAFLRMILANVNVAALSDGEKTMLRDLCRAYQGTDHRLVGHLAALRGSSEDAAVDSGSDGGDADPGSPNGSSFVAHGVTDTAGGRRDVNTIRFSELYEAYVNGGDAAALTGLKAEFVEMASTLPHILRWNSLWQMLHVIELAGCVDMLPLLRSFMEEAFLGFASLGEAASRLRSITMMVVKSAPGSSELVLQLDSCARMVELFTASELRRDYGDLKAFASFLELLVQCRRVVKGSDGMDGDARSILSALCDTLHAYLMAFGGAKHGLMSSPVPHTAYQSVCRSIVCHSQRQEDGESHSAALTLELLQQSIGSENADFISCNAELIRHILLQGYLQSGQQLVA